MKIPYKKVSILNSQFYIDNLLLKSPMGLEFIINNDILSNIILNELNQNRNTIIKEFKEMPTIKALFTFLDKFNYEKSFEVCFSNISYDCIFFLENHTQETNVIIDFFKNNYDLNLLNTNKLDLISPFNNINKELLNTTISKLTPIEQFGVFDIAETIDSLIIAIYGILHKKSEKWFLEQAFADEIAHAIRWGIDNLAEKRRNGLANNIKSTLNLLNMY